MNELEEPKKTFMDKMMADAAKSMQGDWDSCKVCKRKLPPGTPSNKLYDDGLGSITVCVDCSIRAIAWYVRNLYSADKAR